MSVRWALEEAGRPYDVRLVSLSAMKEAGHKALHPFGQIPTYEAGDVCLFESGSIVLHIAEQHAGLLPDDVARRARAITWIFAAVTTVEPPIFELDMISYVDGGKPWYKERRAVLEDRVRSRLNDLSYRIGAADWLEQSFTAGDLMMVMTLRRLKGSGIEEEYPVLTDYVARAEARPAFKRAFEAQLAAFTGEPQIGPETA